MTAARTRSDAAQARKASRALLAEARDHERLATRYRRMAERELERARELDRKSKKLARDEKRSRGSRGKAKKKPGRPEPVARGKACSVWVANGDWTEHGKVRTLEAGRAMAKRIRSSEDKPAVVVRPAGEGPPPWPPPPSSRA
jgi:hypothetical protein